MRTGVDQTPSMSIFWTIMHGHDDDNALSTIKSPFCVHSSVLGTTLITGSYQSLVRTPHMHGLDNIYRGFHLRSTDPFGRPSFIFSFVSICLY